MPRDPRTAAAADYDEVERTIADGRRGAAPPSPPPAAGSRPKKLPAFVPAETVVPIVSYRSPARPTPAPPVRPVPQPAPAPAPAPVASPDLSQALAMLEASVVQAIPTRPAPAPQPAPQLAHRGELIVVFGCRGGAGATTLAVNTAAALVRARRQVCVVDLDLQLGDVFVALDLEPQTSLAAVAREAGALDAASLRRRLAQHDSGLCALTQAGHVDELDPTLPARLPALLDTLRAHFDYVVVDGVRDFGDAALAALEAATQILVVVTQDVPSVRRAARTLTLLRRIGIAEGRCRLVINRAVRNAAIDDAAIERALAMRIAARVRDDARATDALDAGALLLDLARSRGVADDLAALATLCRAGETQRVAAAAPRRRFSLGGLLRKGGS